MSLTEQIGTGQTMKLMTTCYQLLGFKYIRIILINYDIQFKNKDDIANWQDQ